MANYLSPSLQYAWKSGGGSPDILQMLLKSHHEQESVFHGKYLAKSALKFQFHTIETQENALFGGIGRIRIPVVGESAESEQFLGVHRRTRRASV
jgi:hypothetical protein